MHIKQIIIQGFKSYKDQTVIEPFSAKHNVIVGRNGSGKSNFFAAIRFVLSDAYTQMGREERQALLHEGSGSAVMSAYVEIIFDNSDERFPTGKDELILRRTIGLKKDEYSLDRKNATKSDVMNLLESAGFSRSNPYYIVPQGRVTTLTNMKDHERLTLLKEVAGTQVYEARRSESLKIMTDTDTKRGKIDELLVYINERLDELEEEKEELRIYQEKDKDRRCLEYTIYNREKEASTKALDHIDEQRNRGAEDNDQAREAFLDGEKELATIDEQIKALKQQIELLRLDRRQYEDERKIAAKEKAQIELEVSSIADGQSSADKARAHHKKELKDVQNSIRDREKLLSSIVPQYDKASKSEGVIKGQLDDAEASRQRLYAKQGRSAKFKSKKERDDWLKKEIDDVNIALAQRKAVTMQTTEDIAELQAGIKSTSAEISQIRDTLDGRGESMESMSSEVQKAKDVRDRLQDQRKELWREEAKLDSVMKNSQEELNRAERFLSHMMDQNTSRGLSSVRRIKQQHQLDGVYGTLAELFTVPDMFKTAAEVTAGTSLFHYVVDNEETATKVLEILQKEKGGRVTFMPLNRLKPSTPNMPTANDAIPLISKLSFDQKYTKAFEQVFGKTIVCPRLEIAAQYARSHGVTAITPDGDRSDKKGALTGGFHDPRQSRLDGVRGVAKWRDEVDLHRNRGAEIKRELEQKDQEITHAVGDLQKADQKRRQAENSYGPLQQELRSKTSDLQSKQDALEAKQRSKTNVDAALRDLSDQQTSYETELASEFKKALTQDEEQQLLHLGATIPNLQKNFMDLSSTRADLEVQKSTIDVELRENLRPRLDQLKAQEHENGSETASSRLHEKQQDLQRATRALEGVDKKFQEVESSIEESTTELGQIENTRAQKQQAQEETAKEIESYQRKMEKGMSKRARLVEALAEASKNIRDLGVLPQEAFTKFARLDSNAAIKKLHAVNEELKKYGHVNKKAYQQYVNFTKQREDLQKRRAELDSSQNSIRDLIEVLDQRKDEAIERTFRQVSLNFSKVFGRLVPAGKGRLVIQRRSDQVANAEDDDSDEPEQREGVENYTGVGIAVSFNSKHDEQQRIQQLSGGQKSLCALALVFAIQQCDPAPFYLFDEIDANLDAQYRTAVAALLEEISEDEESGGAQFICTTFRPEMVLVADKCYGVSYSNKTSSIDAVDKETALNFVEGKI